MQFNLSIYLARYGLGWASSGIVLMELILGAGYLDRCMHSVFPVMNCGMMP